MKKTEASDTGQNQEANKQPQLTAASVALPEGVCLTERQSEGAESAKSHYMAKPDLVLTL